MQVIQTKVYTFDELSDEAKEKAREWYREGMDYGFTWENIQEDAMQIGLRVISIDNHKTNQGEFITSAPECAENILAQHGKDCETYKTAKVYYEALEEAPEDDTPEREVWEEKRDDADHEFLYSLLEDYRIMYNKDCEYQYSNESVDESILINEYTFTESGKRFG